LRAPLDLRKLEAADVGTGRSVGGAAEKSGKSLNIPDIVALRLVAEGPEGHVRDHAVAKIADRLVTHRRLLSCAWNLATLNPGAGPPAPSSLLDQLLSASSPLAPFARSAFPRERVRSLTRRRRLQSAWPVTSLAH